MVMQLLTVSTIMDLNYFEHNDLNENNIAYIKTNEKYVYYNNYRIPTFGYIYQIIDYDSIKSYRVIQGQNKNKIEINNDENHNSKQQNINNVRSNILKIIIKVFINKDNLLGCFYKNRIRYNRANEIKKFKKLPEYSNLLNLYKLDDFLLYKIFQIFYQESHQRLILGDKFKKTINLKFYVPFEDIKFMIETIIKNNTRNTYNIIMKYLFNKLKS
jgi:hypothetical protein